jgi:outer membrane protein OmpA-like peptidoglycan-associated protein
MARHWNLLLASTVLLASCTSIPRPDMPDGSKRVAVNSQTAIEDYKARLAEEDARYSARTAMQRQLDGLKRELADVKQYLTILAAGGEAAAPTKRRGDRQPARASLDSPEVAPTAAVVIPTPRESIEIREQSVIFRYSHEQGRSAFAPSEKFSQSLLEAVRRAPNVEVRGRTDAPKADDPNRRIALARAMAAKRFLLAQGISENKIEIDVLAAGGYAANNATAEGQARNRRVEIEAMDIDTATIKPLLAMLNRSEP